MDSFDDRKFGLEMDRFFNNLEFAGRDERVKNIEQVREVFKLFATLYDEELLRIACAGQNDAANQRNIEYLVGFVEGRFKQVFKDGVCYWMHKFDQALDRENSKTIPQIMNFEELIRQSESEIRALRTSPGRPLAEDRGDSTLPQKSAELAVYEKELKLIIDNFKRLAGL